MTAEKIEVVDEKSANERIAQLKNEIGENFYEITCIAREYGISVYFDGPTYGMGGSVYGDEDGEWHSSSEYC